jgi:hypothetical protein
MSSILAVNGSLPDGEGVQDIKPYILHEVPSTYPPPPYTRGYYYAIPYPNEYSARIRTGTWLTLGFGWVNDKINVPYEEIEQAKEDLLSWLPPVIITFNAEAIDTEAYWRPDDFFVIRMEDQTIYPDYEPGTYLVYLPWRYYIPPRAVGRYIIYADFPLANDDLLHLTGWIEWYPPPEL